MTDSPSTLAAVDLGSNSFHMVVARVQGADFQVLDRVKSSVRLAAGLDSRGRLSADARERALACLRTFGERVRELPPGSVRAVGTNTLRKAQDARAFLAEAERALGHPIEIISGHEEARLIYTGVWRDVVAPGRRLVVDIGGGSTELILGEGPEPRRLDSLFMGAVSWSQRYFPEGEIKKEGLRRGVMAASLELEPVAARYRAEGWDLAIGSSGTILAIEKILIESGLAPEGISPRGLRRLRAALLKAGRVGALRLPGLQNDRRPVLPGGLAVLSAVVGVLGVERLRTSQSALREGVLIDLLGRLRHEDIRAHSIDALAARFGCDLAQARRVEQTAIQLFDQVAESWALDLDVDRPLLGWAARCHELGLFIAWSGHHKHGAYILANADLAGFSKGEQGALAALVLGHRGRLEAARLSELCPNPPAALLRLAVLLRLSARLHRSRADRPLPPLELSAVASALTLHLPEGALDDRPLTAADLEEEAEALAAAGFALQVREG